MLDLFDSHLLRHFPHLLMALLRWVYLTCTQMFYGYLGRFVTCILFVTCCIEKFTVYEGVSKDSKCGFSHNIVKSL